MSKIWSNPAVWLAAVLGAALVYAFVRDDWQPRVRVDTPITYAPPPVPHIEPTHGTANWWCVSGMKCWHSTDACDADRRNVFSANGNDLPCTAVDVAACLEVERILTKERTRECYASIAFCKRAVEQWRSKEPDDVKVVVECVPE